MSAAVLAAPCRATRRWRPQVGLFAGAYLAYSAARWLCVGDLETARDHANWIVDLERSMLVDVEDSVQDGLTGTPILWLLNHLYLLAQLVVLPAALVWLYRRDFRIYRRLRDTVLATWLISVPIYAAFPVAPPRLAGLGFTDTITEQTGVALDSSLTTSFYNELAAVPSLHVGFAAAVSMALALALRPTWARIAALSSGPLIALAVVATGNHFVFDVVAGLIVTVAGFALGIAVHRPLGWFTRARLVVIGAGAAATAAALLVLLGVVPLPDPDAALEDASRTLGGWTYPVVAGLALLETGAFVGLLVPGETAVVVGGVVAARGEVDLVAFIGLVWLAAAAGDFISFVLGRRLGRPFLERHGPRVRLGADRLRRVERFYARHGGKAVLLGRFTGVVRAVSPFIAGASRLALRRFALWSAVGSLLWATTFTLVGYGFSESFAESGETAANVVLALALLAALGLATVALLRSRRGRTPWSGPSTRPARRERSSSWS
jgi:membrane protein DedA with SNARE-associated domain